MFEDQSVDIPCPSCGTTTALKVSEIKTGTEIECPGCENTIVLKADQFEEGIADTEKMLRDFQRDFGKRRR